MSWVVLDEHLGLEWLQHEVGKLACGAKVGVLALVVLEEGPRDVFAVRADI
jgi:hypothetical protein